MLKIFYWLTILMPVVLSGQSKPGTDSFTVYFFLLEDCQITQSYTDKIQSLYQEFSNDSIRFWGGFPNPVSEDSTVRSFVSKYQIPFACTREGAYELAKRFGVSVTPEVVVYNETRQQVVYQGRIDNMFERIGQRRQVVTEHELATALRCIRDHKPVPVPRTKAVGCFLK